MAKKKSAASIAKPQAAQAAAVDIDDIFAKPKAKAAPLSKDQGKKGKSDKKDKESKDKKKKSSSSAAETKVVEAAKKAGKTKASKPAEPESDDDSDMDSMDDLPSDFDSEMDEDEDQVPSTGRKVIEVVDPSIAVAEALRRAKTAASGKGAGAAASTGGKKSRKEVEEDRAWRDSRGDANRRHTEEGYPIFKEAELGVNAESGGTPLCPFDCDCCF